MGIDAEGWRLAMGLATQLRLAVVARDHYYG